MGATCLSPAADGLAYLALWMMPRSMPVRRWGFIMGNIWRGLNRDKTIEIEKLCGEMEKRYDG